MLLSSACAGPCRGTLAGPGPPCHGSRHMNARTGSGRRSMVGRTGSGRPALCRAGPSTSAARPTTVTETSNGQLPTPLLENIQRSTDDALFGKACIKVIMMVGFCACSPGSASKGMGSEGSPDRQRIGQQDVLMHTCLPHVRCPLQPRPQVVGVGGGGSNAVNRMISANLKSIDFWVLNTDAQVGWVADSLLEPGGTLVCAVPWRCSSRCLSLPACSGTNCAQRNCAPWVPIGHSAAASAPLTFPARLCRRWPARPCRGSTRCRSGRR